MNARKDDLLAAIVDALRPDARIRKACRIRIEDRIEGLKALRDFYARNPSPGAAKRRAKAAARLWRKARALTESIGPFFAAVYEDNGGFGGVRDWRQPVNHVIATADYLSEKLVVPKGSKRRNPEKFLAKKCAEELVQEFYPLAYGRREVTILVAEWIYEIIVGRCCKNISETAAAYRPAPYRTRGHPPRLTVKKHSL